MCYSRAHAMIEDTINSMFYNRNLLQICKSKISTLLCCSFQNITLIGTKKYHMMIITQTEW